MSDWFNTGPYVPEPMSQSQRFVLSRVLRQNRDFLLGLLDHEERVAVELMGAEEWLALLTKWEATRLVGAIKDAEVAEQVRRRPAKPIRKENHRKRAADSGRVGADSPVRRKWWATR